LFEHLLQLFFFELVLGYHLVDELRNAR
jgi:hypothetical protein